MKRNSRSEANLNHDREVDDAAQAVVVAQLANAARLKG